MPEERATVHARGRLCEKSIGALPIAPLHFCDRVSHKLLEHRVIKIGKPREVQTGFSHLVLAKPGQQYALLFSFCYKVDHEFPAADSKPANGASPARPLP